jgi:hypothetical protein
MSHPQPAPRLASVMSLMQAPDRLTAAYAGLLARARHGGHHPEPPLGAIQHWHAWELVVLICGVPTEVARQGRAVLEFAHNEAWPAHTAIGAAFLAQMACEAIDDPCAAYLRWVAVLCAQPAHEVAA